MGHAMNLFLYVLSGHIFSRQVIEMELHRSSGAVLYNSYMGVIFIHLKAIHQTTNEILKTLKVFSGNAARCVGDDSKVQRDIAAH